MRPGGRSEARDERLPQRAAMFALLLAQAFAAANASDAAPRDSGLQLNARCPASYELLPNNSCVFRSLYDFYDSPPGYGGLRAKLPPRRDGFTPQQIDLGRYLFFDPLLSGDHSVSCAHCHHPDHGFADGRARSMGFKGVGTGSGRRGGAELPRGAPSLWNVGFLKTLFWDSRSSTLEQQARGPLFTATEMGNTPEQLERDLNACAQWRSLFGDAFGLAATDRLTVDHAARALAAFESTLIPPNARRSLRTRPRRMR